MANNYPIRGASAKKVESTFTIDPEDVDPMPDLDYAKNWLMEKVAEAIETDVTDNPFEIDGISVTLRMYSARGRKPC